MEQSCNCFDNFIGILDKNCCGDWQPSQSGYYIENLSGLTIKKINDTVDEQHRGAFDLIRKKLSFAARSVCEEAFQRSQGVKFRKALQKIEIGRPAPLDFLPAVDLNRGLFFERQYTPLSVLRIEEIKFHFANLLPDDAQVIILEGKSLNAPTKSTAFDLIDECSTQPVSSPICIRPNYVAEDCFVWIVVNNTNISPQKVWIGKDCGTCGCMGLYENGGLYPTTQIINGMQRSLSVSGWDGEKVSPNIFGLEVKASLECSTDKALCLIASALPLAILYRAGVEIIKARLATDRMNFITIHGKEWAEKIEVEWMQMSLTYMDNAMPQIQEMLTDYDSVCLPCNGTYRVASMIG